MLELSWIALAAFSLSAALAGGSVALMWAKAREPVPAEDVYVDGVLGDGKRQELGKLTGSLRQIGSTPAAINTAPYVRLELYRREDPDE